MAVSRTRLKEMRDFVVLPTNHFLMLYDDEAAARAIAFIRFGRF